MKVELRFFESDPKWNIYTTLATSLNIIILHFAGVKLTTRHLVLLSILSMFNGDILGKCVLAFFLHLILYAELGLSQLYSALLGVACVALAHYLEKQEPTQSTVDMIHANTPARLFVTVAYYIWMVVIAYLYFTPLITQSTFH